MKSDKVELIVDVIVDGLKKFPDYPWNSAIFSNRIGMGGVLAAT
jgi:hypothetical protein